MYVFMKLCRNLSKNSHFQREIKRLFMSKSFLCEESWASRLKSPILQKVSLDDLFYELDNKFNQTRNVSAIDVDIFVNTVNHADYIDEMEDLVHKLRLSNEGANIFDSTHYAFIRNYLEYGDSDELMRILNDRLNYGIFPDKFTCILLFDTFIKKEDFCNAAKVATLQMLQEDFSNFLINYLSLYSCHKYLINRVEWNKQGDPEPEPDDGEEVKVRVKYLRNPYFDDHFDLKDPNDLIGKTLYMIGNELKNPLGNSYKLLGLILYKKWDKAEECLTSFLKSKEQIYNDTIELAEGFIEQMITQKLDSESFVKTKDNLIRGLKLLKDDSTCIKNNVVELLEELINSDVQSTETTLIKEQIQAYEDWETNRDLELRNQLEELNKQTKLQEVQLKKEEMMRKEEELFFFEKEDELDLTIENKRVPYPRKWLGKKKKKLASKDDYIPPEITKQTTKTL